MEPASELCMKIQRTSGDNGKRVSREVFAVNQGGTTGVLRSLFWDEELFLFLCNGNLMKKKEKKTWQRKRN